MIDGNLQRVLVKRWVTHNEYIAWANEYEAEMAKWKDCNLPTIKIKQGMTEEQIDNELDYYREVRDKIKEAKQFICVSKEEVI